MKLTFLGTGTSTGIPQLRCDCQVCTSTDPRDKRLRTSALLSTPKANILIDCSPDFRAQMLASGTPRLDALLVTHSHYDHLGGLDDLRPYCISHPNGFPIYCTPDVAADIQKRMPYCFGPAPYPGAPRFDIHIIGSSPIRIADIEILPLPVMHTPALPIVGYRIGPLCYITDCKIMPPSTHRKIAGCRTLVIDALRWERHPSHLSLREALDIIAEVKPERAFLIHVSHQLGLHAQVAEKLPHGVELAFDSLSIDI